MYPNRVFGCLLAAFVVSTAAAQQAADKSQAQAPAGKAASAARAKAAPAAIALPAGAVQTGQGTYSYTDPEGKKWLYRQTPWGMSKAEEQPKSEQAAAQAESLEKQLAATRAVEDGEVIRFERPGPFGVYRWTRKKTELRPTEQAAWERDRTLKSGAPEKE
jgi:ABC-type uncharacterized transport system permease subunit